MQEPVAFNKRLGNALGRVVAAVTDGDNKLASEGLCANRSSCRSGWTPRTTPSPALPARHHRLRAGARWCMNGRMTDGPVKLLTGDADALRELVLELLAEVKAQASRIAALEARPQYSYTYGPAYTNPKIDWRYVTYTAPYLATSIAAVQSATNVT